MEDAPAAAGAGAGAEDAAVKVDAGGATANGVAKEGSARTAKLVRGAAALQPVREGAVETTSCSCALCCWTSAAMKSCLCSCRPSIGHSVGC